MAARTSPKAAQKPAAQGRRPQPRGAARLLPRDAADPPLRGEGRPALRHGPDRRLLPPLHRPGGRGGRHPARAAARRQRDHRLPRPRPHAGLQHGPAPGHGRAHRPQHRLLQGQGRLDAHVRPLGRLLRRARHRRRPGAARHRPRLRPPVPRGRRHLRRLHGRRRGQPGPGLRELQHGGLVEAADPLRDREQPLRHGHLAGPRRRRPDACASAATPTASPATRSTAWTWSRCTPRPRSWSARSAAARGR